MGRLERRWTERAARGGEVRHLVTSLPPTTAPDDLLALARGHWGIENRLPSVRDVTVGEDACRVRGDAAPQVLAALRHVVLTLRRAAGHTNIAAALRTIAWRGSALTLLRLTTT